MKKAILLSIYLYLSLYTFSQEVNDGPCIPDMTLHSIKEVEINSPTISSMLETILKRLEEEAIEGFNTPYRKVLLIQMAGSGILQFTLSSSNGSHQPPLETDYALVFNEHILILRKSPDISRADEKLIWKYFKKTNNKVEYKSYNYIKEKTACLITPLIFQKIIVYVKGEKYHLDSDCINRTDFSFFYD